MIALIPAKSTSKRVKDKNIKKLAGHPLMAYTIRAALDSKSFERVVVVTDSMDYSLIAHNYGAESMTRPSYTVEPNSPDIDWVLWCMQVLWTDYVRPEAFCILRPTNPFRTKETIWRGVENWDKYDGYDSMRCVTPVKQHPGKMWVVRNNAMYPLLPMQPQSQPWHSSQTQTLPTVYVQNGMMEIANTSMMFATRTIAGSRVLPFYSRGYEALDINDGYDWAIAELLVRTGKARLPDVNA